MPARDLQPDVYGQVAGLLTASVVTLVPSVTVTVDVVAPVPGPAGPARDMVSVLVAMTALIFGSWLLTLNVPVPPTTEAVTDWAQPTVTGFGTTWIGTTGVAEPASVVTVTVVRAPSESVMTTVALPQMDGLPAVTVKTPGCELLVVGVTLTNDVFELLAVYGGTPSKTCTVPLPVPQSAVVAPVKVNVLGNAVSVVPA